MPSATAATGTETIPTGAYRADPAHSSATFAVDHGALATFRGGFGEVDATLESAGGDLRLAGAVRVESLDVSEPDLRAHLLSAEFFGAGKHPEIGFRSNELRIEGERVELTGELEIRGQGRPVVATGRLRGPGVGADGSDRIALELEATVDRHSYGIDWQMELPNGEPALGDEVTLTVVLELVRSG